LHHVSFKKLPMSSTIEKVIQQPIQISESALRQLYRIKEEQNVPEGHGLRVGVKGGGCSGFSYILGFDVPKENDETFQIGGITIFMQKAHAIYLMGMEVGWLDGLNNRGFTFSNPNATDTCGCGTSFSA
jgi:iron-sulfur cluster assembly protein